MITDKLALFFDDKAAASSDNSGFIHTGMYIGRAEPFMAAIIVRGANAAAVNLTVTIQESDDKAAWTAVGTVPVAKPDAKAAFVTFSLPPGVKKKYVRLSYALSGSAAGLTIWAGVTRDHFAPYEPGLYFNKGGLEG